MKLEHFAETDTRQPLAFPHFPTRLQGVVWRNWGLVPADRLARTLKATEPELSELARGMGLPVPEEANPAWLTRGYITILRANWHLLPYEQLLTLLDWTEEQLAFALQEDDFLWIKLGSLKPAIPPVYYRPLNEGERRETEKFRERLELHFAPVAGVSRSSFAFGKPGRSGEEASGAFELPPLAKPEKPFEFLNGFSNNDTAKALNIREQSAGGGTDGEKTDATLTLLDDSFAIIVPEGLPRARTFAERFAREHERAWGVKLDVLEGEAAARPSALKLEIGPNPGKLRESHIVEVGEHTVKVAAVDENGLLRGLQWIEEEMTERGGPHLERGIARRDTRYEFRLLYSYFAVYGDPLLDPELDPYPDDLLARLSKVGVNAIWLQCVLYQLVPFAEAPELSVGWERRIEGLQRLSERAADYGIGVYLYFNEPRSMPLEFFEQRPDWRGHTIGTYASMCTSHPEVQRYLKEATADLFRRAPELAGLYTITMSENLTNCYSKAVNGQTNCPRCAARPEEEVVAEVNRLIAEGAQSVKPDAHIVSYTWAWRQTLGFTKEMLDRCVSLLPDGMAVMSVSEDEMPTNIAGVAGQVIDYSISLVGPSDKTRGIWQAARENGLPAYAKVQFNNSWECSAVPYLPVFDLVLEHMGNLNREGVSGLMLSWTLGGYPSPTLEMVSQHYWATERSTSLDAAGSGPKRAGDAGASLGDWLAGKFGADAGAGIARASAAFSKAFRDFPFHVSVLYTAPQNSGPSNLLHVHPTGYSATMVGFPYDDVKRWRAIYPADTFEEQFRKLAEGWEKGLEALAEAGRLVKGEGRTAAYTDLVHVSLGSYYHFRSTYYQIAFILEREKLAAAENPEARERSRARMKELAGLELETARQMYDLMLRDSRLAYEASNHYYYTARMLQEKVLNCMDVNARLNEADTADVGA
ncbi:hypothetical protein FE784_25335 [Paenibacillus hemerocallicola]|uniref:Beta-hexosaminidase bacterial type N-terminal domain-containing protein n=1 Tax=Paenibacillus hemerocallicola TaxID=1172614 RepID=A0A5C4T361_9BACL|nr:hypothetical protein [Paenibacillus hemerocallicola]TNJ63502.1 hypothetical protein FE784_25335 [Paenibacillus hemerocallicola]